MSFDKSEVKREAFDLSSLKNKLNNLEKQQHSHDSECEGCEDDHDYLLDYPLSQRRVIRALEGLQEKRAVIEAEFRAEVIELEKKYLARYQPFYEDRAKLVAGEREPTAEEYAGIPESQVAEVDESGAEIKGSSGIPQFWLTVLKNHPEVSQLVFDGDSAALEALKDIQVHYLVGNPGFRLDFLFGPNDYFTNEVLSKEYHLENSTSVDYDDLVYDHAVGTPINWKEGKNLCFKTVSKTQRQKNGKGTRVVRRQEPCESFFHFFSPPSMPKDDEEDADEDAQDPDELEEQLQLDYDLGDIIKSQIVPMAADWFTGKALEYGDYDDEDDEEDYDYDTEDEDDEEDDEDEESEDEAPRRSSKNARHPKPSGATGAAGPNQEQCKQQ